MRLTKTTNSKFFFRKKNSYEFHLQLIIEKFLFQLQHRIYKAEKYNNEKHVLNLQTLFSKSWCIHVFVRWICYKLSFSESNYYKILYFKLKTKKSLADLLPEYYLTLLMLQPRWEARFEQNSLGFHIDFTTYNTVSIINKNLKKQKQYILKFELNSENDIKILLPKNQDKFIIFNKKIIQQFNILYLNSLKQNLKISRFEENDLFETQQFLYLELTSFCNTNFSIYSQIFFISKVKKEILNKIFQIDNKISLQQNKKVKHKYMFGSFINNNYLCHKIELLVGQKFYILQKFLRFSKYKLFIGKFIKFNKNNFYFNQLKFSYLYGFFTNILLHGLESDYYHWVNMAYRHNFQKFGCLIRYGNQIVLLHPSLEYLKDSDLFFKKWCNSKNIKFNLKSKKITNSLIKTIKNSFLNRNLKLLSFSNKSKELYKDSKRHNLTEKVRHSEKNLQKIFKKSSKDFYLYKLVTLTEFVLETIKPTFLQKNTLFCYKKLNVDLFLNSSENTLKITNKDPLKLNFHFTMDTFKTKPSSFIFYRQSFKTTSKNNKNMRGLIFLGFYICQFKFYSKMNTMNFSKVIYETRIFPTKLGVKYHLELLKKITRKNHTKTQKVLIQKLSPYIYIWSYYHNITSTKKIHAYCDFVVFKMLWYWACKRHSNKSKRWIKSKYFHCLNGKNWVFGVHQKPNSSFYCLPTHMDVKLNNI